LCDGDQKTQRRDIEAEWIAKKVERVKLTEKFTKYDPAAG